MRSSSTRPSSIAPRPGRRRRSRRPCRSRKAPQLPPRQVTPRRAGRCPGRCRACGWRRPSGSRTRRRRTPPELVVAHRRIRLPHQHRLVEACGRTDSRRARRPARCGSETVLARGLPPERALAVGDKAVHRDAHRVDQHGFKLAAPERRTMIVMRLTFWARDRGSPSFCSLLCPAPRRGFVSRSVSRWRSDRPLTG